MVGACTAGKGKHARSFHSWVNIHGQTFNHKNHEYFAPRKLPLYTVLSVEILSVAESDIEAPIAAIESLVSC